MRQKMICLVTPTRTLNNRDAYEINIVMSDVVKRERKTVRTFVEPLYKEYCEYWLQEYR
jgi:hypothetical protein